MADIGARIQRVIEEMTGNEALLGMLETDAAMEMLEWSKTLATAVVNSTADLDDFAADLALLPRLKAVRQTIRWVGNWAAGKYEDPADRVQLRDKLLQNLETMTDNKSSLPSAGQLDAVLNETDDKSNTPLQLILKLKALLQSAL